MQSSCLNDFLSVEESCLESQQTGSWDEVDNMYCTCTSLSPSVCPVCPQRSKSDKSQNSFVSDSKVKNVTSQEFWVSAPPSRPSVAPAQPVWSPTVAMTALPFWFWMSFSKVSIQNLRLKPAALHFQSAVCCSLPAPPLPQKLPGHSFTLQRTIHNSLLIICLSKSSKCRDSRNCSNCCNM